MQKLIPFLVVAMIAIGCKGGSSDPSMAAGTAGTTGTTGTSAPAPSADGTYDLKLSPKVGDKFAYDMSVDGGGAQGKMEVGMTMTCAKEQGGKFLMDMTMDYMKMGGQDMSGMMNDSKNSKTTLEMDSTGKTLSSQSSGNSQTSSNFAGVQFSGKPVKIGDTWDGRSGAGENEVDAKFKLAKVDSEGGKQIATIEVTPSSVKNGRLDGPMIVKVDMANGMPILMTMKVIGKMPDGKESSAQMEMKLR